MLTQADVEKLLASPNAATRAEVASKIGVEVDNPGLSGSEVALAQDIIRALAGDVAVNVRESLAQSIRKASRVPPEVARKLAADVEQVALPILEDCALLTDADLVAIIQQGSAAKQTSIAKRAVVSAPVAAAIVATGNEAPVVTLVGNRGAEIAPAVLEQAIQQHGQQPEFQEKIVARPQLPVQIAEKLVHMVADKYKNYLLTHHELPPTLATDLILQSREQATLNLANTASDAELQRLVQQLKANDRLTATLMIRALCMGEVGFFEAAMAELAGVPLLNVRILVHDAGLLGLRSLYQKTGLPAAFLGVVRTALEVVHETTLDGGPDDVLRYRRRVLERILTHCEALEPTDADYLLDKLGDVMAPRAA